MAPSRGRERSLGVSVRGWDQGWIRALASRLTRSGGDGGVGAAARAVCGFGGRRGAAYMPPVTLLSRPSSVGSVPVSPWELCRSLRREGGGGCGGSRGVAGGEAGGEGGAGWGAIPAASPHPLLPSGSRHPPPSAAPSPTLGHAQFTAAVAAVAVGGAARADGAATATGGGQRQQQPRPGRRGAEALRREAMVAVACRRPVPSGGR